MLTKDQKIDFIHDLTRMVRKRIIDRVNEMPEDWDGIELRQYIADKFAEQCWPRWNENRKRKRDYNNEVLVRNL